jgi:hypothetical protein
VEDMDWAYLAVDRDRWWSPVNAVMNIHGTKRRFNNFLNSCAIIEFSEGKREDLLHGIRQCDR